MTPFVTSNLLKKVSLIKWVRKDLENSTLEFTGYLNSCVSYIKEIYVLENKCYTPNV